MSVVFILSAGADFGKARVLCLDGLGFSPSGETGEGLGEDVPPLFFGNLPLRYASGMLRGMRAGEVPVIFLIVHVPPFEGKLPEYCHLL